MVGTEKKATRNKGFWARLFAPQTFEVPVPEGDGRCTDNSCPCPEPGTLIPRGSGYLYISPEAVKFRSDCRSIHDFRAKMERIQSGEVSYSFLGAPELIAPILVCEKGAKRRKLDLDAAAQDARSWWETGEVPLRASRKR